MLAARAFLCSGLIFLLLAGSKRPSQEGRGKVDSFCGRQVELTSNLNCGVWANDLPCPQRLHDYDPCLLTGPRFSEQKADTTRQTADAPVRSHAATVRRLEIILSKEVDRWFEAVGQLYLWLPSEFCFRQRNIWLALFGVVLG